ncbi:four helix bundle protein [Lysinibacillus sp. FSL K6-0232]|uniref:four helix bundle protein n=1 Tax=Lysinibacillus sp. FSL K6-0232 TaxID=2921425 RepID=UPI0030F969A7
MYVEDFKKLSLYQNSLDFYYAVYRFIDNNAMELSNEEKLKIRKMTVRIPVAIAAGIGQMNMKIRFKRLNMAKGLLEELKTLTSELLLKSRIEHEDDIELQYYYDQVIRLINSYFGWLSKNNKSKISI